MSFDGLTEPESLAEAGWADAQPPHQQLPNPKTRGQLLLEEMLAVHERNAALVARLGRAIGNIDDAAPRLGAVPNSQTFPGVAEVTSFFSGARAMNALGQATADQFEKMVERLESMF